MQNIPRAYQYLVGLSTTDPALFANFTKDISNWMLAETLAPQQIDLLPFPIKAYTSNAFYSSVAGLLPFFLVIATLFPVTRLISSLVAEKETKIREGMRMMGLSDAALLGSWYAMYSIVFFIIAVIIAIMTRPNIFKASNPVTIWFVFYSALRVCVCWTVRDEGGHFCLSPQCSSCRRWRFHTSFRCSSLKRAQPLGWGSSSISAATLLTMASATPPSLHPRRLGRRSSPRLVSPSSFNLSQTSKTTVSALT